MTALGWPERSQPPRSEPTKHLARLGNVVASGLRASPRALAHATWIASLTGAIVLTLLALRVWFQLVGETARGGIAGFIYDLSGVLVSPFRQFEPTTPIKDSGILEFSSLVAIEAYLIATLVALTVLFSARLALIAAPHVVRRKRPAAAEEILVAVRESTQT